MVNTELLLSLEILEARLTALGAPVVEHFNPPLPESVVSAALRALGVPAHPDLVTWWGWHDGVPFDQFVSQGMITSAYWPLSLEAAAKIWRETSDHDPDELSPPRELFPVAGWENVATLRVNARTGAVLVDDPHVMTEPLFDPKWRSLTEWVQDAIALFDAGWYRLVGDWVEADRSHWPAGVQRQLHW